MFSSFYSKIYGYEIDNWHAIRRFNARRILQIPESNDLRHVFDVSTETSNILPGIWSSRIALKWLVAAISRWFGCPYDICSADSLKTFTFPAVYKNANWERPLQYFSITVALSKNFSVHLIISVTCFEHQLQSNFFHVYFTRTDINSLVPTKDLSFW